MKFPYIATIAAILLTSQAAIAGGLFPKVVVTVAPLKPYVDEMMRGHGESQSLLRPGQEAHDFALAPSQAEMLDNADVVIVPDLAMSPMLKRILAKKKALVIELSRLEGADPLPYADENPWLDAMKERQKETVSAHKPEAHDDADHEKPAKPGDSKTPLNDPHLWLDPERMAAMAVPLAKAMAEKSPEARPTLVANATALATHLRTQVIPPLKTMLDKPSRRVDAVGKPQIPFITYHAAYQYFLERFNLAHHGELVTRPEDNMGAKSKATLLSGAESVRVRCLIGEQKSTLMERIAEATDANIILLSPEQLVDRSTADALDWIQNDYDRFLYKTAKTFAGCL
jgi:zinc transport system substrate-binding protein